MVDPSRGCHLSRRRNWRRSLGASPDLEIDSVVRWRRIDPKQVIEKHFGVAYRERYVGKLLQELGFSHLSGRPRHPAQDGQIIEHIEKIFPRTLGAHLAGVTRKKKIEIWFQCMVRLRLARRNGDPERILLQRIRLVRGRSSPEPQWEPLGCVPYKMTRHWDPSAVFDGCAEINLLEPSGCTSDQVHGAIVFSLQIMPADRLRRPPAGKRCFGSILPI